MTCEKKRKYSSKKRIILRMIQKERFMIECSTDNYDKECRLRRIDYLNSILDKDGDCG